MGVLHHLSMIGSWCWLSWGPTSKKLDHRTRIYFPSVWRRLKLFEKWMCQVGRRNVVVGMFKVEWQNILMTKWRDDDLIESLICSPVDEERIAEWCSNASPRLRRSSSVTICDYLWLSVTTYLWLSLTISDYLWLPMYVIATTSGARSYFPVWKSMEGGGNVSNHFRTFCSIQGPLPHHLINKYWRLDRSF